MKESDFKQFEFLSKLKENLKSALSQANAFLEMQEARKDSGGIEGYEHGYFCSVSFYQDGSGEIGKKIDLAGCYLGVEMAESAISNISYQIERVNRSLEKIGVEVEDWGS